MRYAIDVGGTKLALGVFDSPTQLLDSRVFPTPTGDWASFLERVDAGLRELSTDRSAPARVGVSVAGVVDPYSGRTRCSNVPVIDGQPLAARLGAALGCEVVVANDADCFALAEARHGEGQGLAVVLALILGTGVGGAVVVDGQLLRGRTGLSGEWGHGNALDAQVAKLGLRARTCPCGLGTCLDLYGAGRGLGNIYADLGGEPCSGRELLARWAAGEARAVQCVDAWAELVASQVALLVNLLDPQRVVVGGGLANDAALLKRLDAAVRQRCLAHHDSPLVVAARYINDGSLRGAAAL